MLLTKIGSSYSSSQFPEEFSNQLYFSENVSLGEFAYRSPYSIKYVLTGYEKYSVEGRGVRINPQEHMLVNNNSEVVTLPASGKAISIFIDPDTLADVQSINDFISIDKILDNHRCLKNEPLIVQEKVYRNENDNVKSILKKIATNLLNGGISGQNEIDPSLFFKLSEAVVLDQCLHSFRLRNLQSVKKSTMQEQYSRLLIGYQYINDNWNKRFSLMKTANESMLSPYHFHRLFSGCFLKTPFQCHLEIQMNKAIEFLENDQFEISEISNLLGYGSSTAFGRAFKNHFGVTPSLFRKKQYL